MNCDLGFPHHSIYVYLQLSSNVLISCFQKFLYWIHSKKRTIEGGGRRQKDKQTHAHTHWKQRFHQTIPFLWGIHTFFPVSLHFLKKNWVQPTELISQLHNKTLYKHCHIMKYIVLLLCSRVKGTGQFTVGRGLWVSLENEG